MKMGCPFSFTCKRSFQVCNFYRPPFTSPPSARIFSFHLCSCFSISVPEFWHHTVDEWNNFLERMKCNSEEELRMLEELEEELRLWASYRGQTLTKTGKDLSF